MKFLEMQIRPEVSTEEKQNYPKQIQQIEERVDKIKMPKNLSDYLYSLKGHIQLVRDRVEKM